MFQLALQTSKRRVVRSSSTRCATSDRPRTPTPPWQAACVEGGPHVVRHTVRTWLADYGVPDADADLAQLIERPFAGRERIDQPQPEEWSEFIGSTWGPSSETRLPQVTDLSGAGNETRTRDPNLGKVVLYQLSYSRSRERGKILGARAAKSRQLRRWSCHVSRSSGHAALRYATIEMSVRAAASTVRATPIG